jgi:Tol biopolymer transport system component
MPAGGGEPGRTAVDICDSDGTGLRQLTHSATPNDRAIQARFAPGGRIIYTRVTPGGRTLWLINADGSNASPIPANGERIRTHGDWQPTPG